MKGNSSKQAEADTTMLDVPEEGETLGRAGMWEWSGM